MINSHETEVSIDEFRQALDDLDLFSGNGRFPDADIADLVGVLAGIKKGAVVAFNDEIADIVHSLGLACYQTDRHSIVVAKDPIDAIRLAHYFTEDDDSDNRHEIGALLGYPKTATDYFIRRSKSLDMPPEEWLPEIRPEVLSGTMHENLSHFILSPENWREEINQYIVPLDAAMKEMVPKTYRRLERSARVQFVGGRLLDIVAARSDAQPDSTEFVAD